MYATVFDDVEKVKIAKNYFMNDLRAFSSFLKDHEYKIREKKTEAPAFVACELVRDEGGRYRAAENARRKDFLCFDLDDVGGVNYSQLVEILRQRIKCAFFIYTTASHTEEKPKIRVIVPLSEPVDLSEMTKEAHTAAHMGAARELGILQFIDKSTHDKARLYFFPSHYPDRPPCSYVENFDADPFPTEKYLKFAAEASEPPTLPILRTVHTAPSREAADGGPERAAEQEQEGVSAEELAALEALARMNGPRAGRMPREKRIFNELVPNVCTVLDKFPDLFKRVAANRYIDRKSTSGTAGIVVYDEGRSAYCFHNNSKLTTFHGLTSFDIIEALFLSRNGGREYNTKDRPSYWAAIECAARLFPEYKERIEQTRQTQGRRERFTYEDFCSVVEGNGIEIYYDSIKNQMKVNAPTLFDDEMSLDSKTFQIMEIVKNSDFKTNLGEICGFMELYSQRNRRNIILELIDAEPWDGHDYLSDFHLMTKNSDPFEQRLFKKWIWQDLSLLENTIEDPISSAGLLLFSGEKEVGKSYLCRKLALDPRYFGSGTLDLRNKDSVIQALSCFVYELNEIGSTLKRSDFNEQKSFLTQATDTYRKPYAHYEIQTPRRTSFCGTVNPEDAGGLFAEKDRRYWFYHIPERIAADLISSFFIMGIFRQVRPEQRQNPKGFMLTEEESIRVIELSKEHLKRENGEEEFLSILTAKQTEKDRNGVIESYHAAWMTLGDFLRKEGKDLNLKSSSFGRICTKNDIPEKRTTAKRLRLLVCRGIDLYEYTQGESEEMRRMREAAEELRQEGRIPTAAAIAERLAERVKARAADLADKEKTQRLPAIPDPIVFDLRQQVRQRRRGLSCSVYNAEAERITEGFDTEEDAERLKSMLCELDGLTESINRTDDIFS